MPKGAKYGGRTPGTPNKKTAVVIERAERILQLIEAKYFEKDIKALSSSQRMVLYSDMLEYVAPKLSRQEINANIKNKVSLHIVRNNTPIKHATSASAEGS